MAQKAGKLLEHAPKTHELRRLEECYLSNDPKSPRNLEAPLIDLEQTGLNQVDVEHVTYILFVFSHKTPKYHICITSSNLILTFSHSTLASLGGCVTAIVEGL